MTEPLCKIARENGGTIPLECLFHCSRNCHAERADTPHPMDTRCKRCGSTDVRWRRQTGKWVLFSMRPGVEHRCDPTDDFSEVA